MFSHFRNWFKQSANFKSVILADPQIICTCDTTYPEVGEPGETPDPAQCLNKPIVFYLLWIEDDFGIGTLEHYDVFAHFLDQLYDQVKYYNVNVTFFNQLTRCNSHSYGQQTIKPFFQVNEDFIIEIRNVRKERNSNQYVVWKSFKLSKGNC